MNWQLVPQFGIAGLLAGGPIALIALGIVLIYKATYIFNFAQGQLLLLGALFTWFFALELGWPIGISIALALVLAALLGLLIERFALRPMTGQPIFAIVLMTLGLAQFLQGVALLLFGGTQRNFPHLFSIENPYRIAMPFYFNGNQITVILKQNLVWSFVVAILAVVLIGAFFQFSRTGLAMRATSEDHELAQSVGLRIRRIFGASWAMAAMVATVSGVLLATSSGLDMSLSLVVLSAFATVLLGGLDSIPGTIVGGLIIGASIGLTKASTVPWIRDMSEIMPYIVLLVVLLIRPEGIFGQRRIERI